MPDIEKLPPAALSPFGSRSPVQSSTYLDIILPFYIKPISKSIERVDLEYLQKKGAFIVPDPAFRDELLRCFVQYVYPFLPVVDLQDFLTAFQKDQAKGPISLLLFHAVMFIATAYADVDILRSRGYTTRWEVRSTFFQRAKLLYSSDFESDRMTVVQSVLLMTYWHETPHDAKDAWYWLDIAVSEAKSVGIHWASYYPALMSPQVKHCWRRIWWCCFMRDQLIGMAMRLPGRINSADFDIPTLDLSDFETDEMPIELTQMLGLCSDVLSTPTRVSLADMCIGLTELCMCISHVLFIQHHNADRRTPTPPISIRSRPPKTSTISLGDFLECDIELDNWYRKRPYLSLCQSPDFRSRNKAKLSKGIDLHQNILTCVFLTTIHNLYRPQRLSSAQAFSISPEFEAMSKRKVREAVDGITNIFKDLYTRDLVRFLPNTGITCLLPAITAHLLEVQAIESSTRHRSLEKFRICLRALQRLRNMYSSASSSFHFLDFAASEGNAESSRPTLFVSKSHLPLDSPPVRYNDFKSNSDFVASPPELGRATIDFKSSPTLISQESRSAAISQLSRANKNSPLQERERGERTMERLSNKLDLADGQEDLSWASSELFTSFGADLFSITEFQTDYMMVDGPQTSEAVSTSPYSDSLW